MEQNTEKFLIPNSQSSILTSYFPDLTDRQKEQYAALYDLYMDWDARINVISRRDIENPYPHYVLRSLGITDMLRFKPGSSVMDLGTGGGFPGILLAILFPETHLHLVDGVGKKIKAGQAVAEAIKLKNVSLRHCRGEKEKQFSDFVVSHVIVPLADLVRTVRRNIRKEQTNVLPDGPICLKGGEPVHEISPSRN